ncbi:hypothetical protein JCGZ_13176 [Jatropha curcas]|uniref:Uncharacterized protein n=1 Tax=Jatropha curcas TaxID=180498 RepID=A0A067K8R7_JATCU|nr:hypothetical protein JCGZ_13176 [Jatropha curcas]
MKVLAQVLLDAEGRAPDASVTILENVCYVLAEERILCSHSRKLLASRYVDIKQNGERISWSP